MMLFDNTPDGWSETTLGEICSSAGGSIQTGPFGSQLHASDYVSEGIPSIMPANIIGGRVLEDGIARITESDAQRLAKYLVQKGDIVYSRRGDVEKCALITESESGWLCGTGCLRIRLGKDVVDPLFAFHFLSHPESKAWISRHAVGATMPNLNTGILSDVPFLLPSSMEQKAIAHILGTLDDKIELDQKMNRTLEEISKAIFKSWFVDFDPVRAKAEGRPTGLPPEISDLFPDELVNSEIGEIPKGWEVYRFTDTFEFSSGGTPKTSVEEYWSGNIPWFSIADLNASSPWVTKTEKSITELGLSKCSAKLINSGTTIVTARGTVGKVALAGQDMAINQSCYAMAAASGYPYTWLYLQTLALVDQLRANAHGSVFDTITRNTFEQFLVLSAPKTVFSAFAETTSPLFERMRTADLESKTLCELRDTLLPKLISGELRIPDAEKFLEEAGI
jgi:type I restriction enzyme S subunit